MDITSASASTASGATSQEHPRLGIVAEIEAEIEKLEGEAKSNLAALVTKLKAHL